MKCEVFISKNTDEWRTPTAIYHRFIDDGYFDPCPYQATTDGLTIEWKDKNFVNPPYSHLKEWVEKSITEAKKGKLVVMLIPARTDTKAFAILWEFGADICFITGRLKFNDAGSAPFPSMLVRLTGTGQTNCTLQNRKDIEV